MKGRYGPYVKHGSVNATLPRDTDPEKLTVEEAVALIAARAGKSPSPKKKAPAKKAAAKKAPADAAAKKAPAKKAAKKPAKAKKPKAA